MEFVPYRCQQEFMRSNAQFRILNKTRQGGFTTEEAVCAAWEMAYVPAAFLVQVSKNEPKVKEFHQRINDAIKWGVKHDPDYPAIAGKAGVTVTRLKNGGEAHSLTSDQDAGISHSPSHFRMDEAAFIRSAKQIKEGALPSLSTTGGRFTMFSNPGDRGTAFHRTWENAEAEGFVKFQYEWWWIPQYNPYYHEFLKAFDAGDKRLVRKIIEKAKTGAWYRKWRPKYDANTWARMYECRFDAGADQVFSSTQLGNVFKKNWLPEVRDELGVAQDGVFHRAEGGPKEGWYYAMAIDLGRKLDATVIGAVGIPPMGRPEMVEFKRIPPGMSDWPLIIQHCHETFEHWGKPHSRHDGTGLGDVISGALGFSEAFTFSQTHNSAKKYELIENLRFGFDESAIVLPKLDPLLKEFEDYKWHDQKIQQDCVMMVALLLSIFYNPERVFSGVDRTFDFV